MNSICNIDNICVTSNSNEEIKPDIDIESLFTTQQYGYVNIWKNIYYSIANQDLDKTLEYIYNSNQSRFKTSKKYVLSIPPSDREKFLYLEQRVFYTFAHLKRPFYLKNKNVYIL